MQHVAKSPHWISSCFLLIYGLIYSINPSRRLGVGGIYCQCFHKDAAMSFFDEKPLRFKVAILGLFLLVFCISVIHFFLLVESPTDENWFVNTPSKIYFTRDLPADVAHTDKESRFDVKTARVVDSVLVGDILVFPFGKKGKPGYLDSLSRFYGQDTLLTLRVYRPAHNRTYSCRISGAQLTAPFYRILPPSVSVFSVIRDGASDRAGMQVGDLILTINGQSFNHSLEADRIMRQAVSGKSITYEVIRHNEVLQLYVTLARFGLPFSLLAFLLAGVAFMALGLFLGLSRPQIVAARLLSCTFLLFGYILTVSIARNNSNESAFDYIRATPLPGLILLTLACWIHSLYHFPRPHTQLLKKRWPQALPYGVALLGLLLSLIIKIDIWSLIMIPFSVWPLVVYRKLKNPESTRLSRILRITVAAVMVLILFTTLIMSRYGQPQSGGYAGYFLILLPAAYLYTIGRYRLLDLNIRIRKNIQYSLAVTCWILLLIAIGVYGFWHLPSTHLQLPSIQLTGSSIEVMDNPQSLQEQQSLEKGVLMVLAVVLVLALWYGGRLGVRFLAVRFHRDHYDYRRATGLLNDVLSKQTGLHDLARRLVNQVAGLMHLQQLAVLFIRDQNQIACDESYGMSAERWQQFCERAACLVIDAVNWLPDRDLFTIDYLPEKMRNDFNEFGFRYLAPIYSHERLNGFFLIGDKLSESPFYQEDFSFLKSISQQTSPAVENAFLYEKLAQRERLKHELEIARRIQLASLPQDTPQAEGLDISGISLPALEVGGDYFDYLNGSTDNLTVVVGDVSGKGISAALYMSKVQGILHSLHSFNLQPRDLCIRLNGLLGQNMEKNYFVTALAAEFRPAQKCLILTRAGHLPLYYYEAATAAVHSLTPGGIGFGLDQSDVFGQELEERRVSYRTGDIFLFVTDGVTEARNSGNQEFGELNLTQLLAKHARQSAVQLRDEVLLAVQQFSANTAQTDDLTVVVVKVL